MQRTLTTAYLSIVILLLLTGCLPTPGTTPESDSGMYFDAEATIPVDNGVYVIVGTVAGDIESLVRQTEAAHGSISGYGGYVSGSYSGPTYEGKGFVRLLVSGSNSPLAVVGSTVLLKTTDTKTIMLLPGDIVRFKCRSQYEAVASIYGGEKFDVDQFETWELDYCRLIDPRIERAGP